MLMPKDGSLNTLFAATSPDVWANKKEYGGAYLMPLGKIEVPSEDAQNKALAEELWGTSESVVKKVLG